MSKKNNPKVSVNVLERIAKEQFPETVTESWFDIEIMIKKSLSLLEMMDFCKEIVDTCFTDKGEFIPEVIDFTIKSGVLTRYANFTLPDNLEKQYTLIYNSGAYDFVVQHINMAQLNEIVNAANRKLKYLCDSDILAFRAKISEFVDSVNNIQKSTSGMMEGLSVEDLRAVLSAADASGGFDETKLVDAYMDRVKKDSRSEPDDTPNSEND